MSSAPPTPPYETFLAPVRPEERSAWRVGVWLAVGGVAAFLGFMAMGLIVEALNIAQIAPDGNAKDYVTGPFELYRMALLLVLEVVFWSVAAVAMIAAARWTWGRPVESFITPVRVFDLKPFMVGALTTILLAAAALGAAVALGLDIAPAVLDPGFAPVQRASYAGAVILTMLVTAFLEEALFRGVILQISSAFVRNPITLCLLNGAVFTLVHLNSDPVAYYEHFILGAVCAWSVLKLGGLEFAVGVHFIANAYVFLCLDPLASVEGAGKPVEIPIALTEAGFYTIAMLALIGVVHQLKGRLKRS